MEEVNYFLAFIVNKKNPMTIDIGRLDENVFDSSLESIDAFTSNYSNEDLIELIRKNNIVTDEYLNGELCVIDQRKHKYPVLLNDTFDDFNLLEFLYKNIDDKDLMNTVYNIYREYVKSIDEIDDMDFKASLANHDVSLCMINILKLPYVKRRSFELYCMNKCKEKQKKRKITKNIA